MAALGISTAVAPAFACLVNACKNLQHFTLIDYPVSHSDAEFAIPGVLDLLEQLSCPGLDGVDLHFTELQWVTSAQDATPGVPPSLEVEPRLLALPFPIKKFQVTLHWHMFGNVVLTEAAVAGRRDLWQQAFPKLHMSGRLELREIRGYSGA